MYVPFKRVTSFQIRNKPFDFRDVQLIYIPLACHDPNPGHREGTPGDAAATMEPTLEAYQETEVLFGIFILV